MASPTIKERALGLLFLTYMFVVAVYFFLHVLLTTILHNPTRPSTWFPLRRHTTQSFGLTWLFLGEGDPASGPNARIIPLLSSASGTILEIGPGSGNLTSLLTNPKIETVYGAEPCEVLHEPLRKVVTKAGLKGKYKVLGCGAERAELRKELQRAGVLDEGDNGEHGVFDVVLCLRVLCTVPDPEQTIEGLYGLLKPGGRMIVLEHVKNNWRSPKGSYLGRFGQVAFQKLGWTFFMGGCELERDTMGMLKSVGQRHGGWEKVDLETTMPWGVIPFVLGELVKRK